MKKWRIITTLLIIIAASILINHATQVFAQTPTSPVLSIASPQENTTIFGTDVVVSFVVGNFSFIDYTQKSNKGKNEGHVLLWVDEPNPNNENAESLLSATDITIHSLSEGKHIVRLEVVNNDQSQYSPRIVKEVLFTIKYPPATEFPTPTPGTISEKVKNFVHTEFIIAAFGTGLISLGIVAFMLMRRST